MKLEVRQVTEVTDSLLEAFGRLMPQLSPLKFKIEYMLIHFSYL